MKQLILLLISLLILCSCQKEPIVNKKLDGKWNVSTMRIEDEEGFTFYDSNPQGTFEFNKSQNHVSASVSYSYQNLEGFTISDAFTLNQNKYSFYSDSKRILIQNSLDTIDARIILLTKNDMQLEYYDLIKFRLVRFILSKD